MVNAAWMILALIHLAPAAVLGRPDLIPSPYGVQASGDVGVLLVHRGALFLAVAAVCLYAASESGGRPASPGTNHARDILPSSVA
jgi:hypothetical protein